MFQSIIGALACGDNGNNDGGGNKNKKMKCSGGKKMVKATVVLMKNKVLAFNDNGASCLDRFHELIGNKVSLQLVSCDVHGGDPSETGLLQGKLGEAAHLENWITTFKRLPSGESAFNVKFDWEEGFGVPGAFIIKNNHHAEFYLRTVTLEDVPDHGHLHFVCNSWVYPTKHCKQDRVFFANKTFLPHQTPEPLRFYRKQELENLRGDGTGKLKKWDRVYDYAYYNDLGVPENERPVLGGSLEYPYPRRGRTGRPSTKKDPKTESRIPLMQSLSIYVPRDEQFSHIKMKDFLKYGLSSIAQFIKPAFEAAIDSTPWEFDTLDDVLKMYDYKESASLHEIRKKVPFKMLKEIFHTDRKRKFPFPTPQVIEADSIAWRTDEEFAREMLAGLNPVVIRCLKQTTAVAAVTTTTATTTAAITNKTHPKPPKSTKIYHHRP